MPVERRGEIERIRALVRHLPGGRGVVVGPGDDAAVLRPAAGRDLVVTTDAFVEGRHFRRDLLPPEGIGRRLAAANLSDLAAMAATPRWALVSCGTPVDADPAEARAIEVACARALAAEGAAVVGGNLSATDGPSWWSVTLVGEVARGAHWTRTGARPGDLVAVTGVPGRAAAALAIALWRNPPTRARGPRELWTGYASPPSRVGLARALAAAGGVHAAIDLSDGLAGDLAQLCAASEVGVELEASRLPADAALWAVARTLAADLTRERAELLPAPERGIAEHLQLGPSDDYELLLAIEPGRFEALARIALRSGTTLAAIGRFSGARGRRVLRRSDGGEAALPDRGFDHFG
ncbi:MAG TPA: thiamine-phosphate kinase [Candidatus Acidoferrales bacterium]|nr:thiamine-phosphate kinase [Candidatus Acidoferrales bacterium]